MILTGLAVLAAQSSPAAPGAAAPTTSMFGALIPFVLVFAIFYVLIILPQRKKQKKHQEQVGALKPGDRIITAAGIYGTIMGVQADRLEVKIAANVKIEITKGSVGVILGPQSGSPDKAE